MAELTNSQTGPGQLAIRITFLPRQAGDQLHDSAVFYFDAQVYAQVAFLAGGRSFWSHTIAAHADTFEHFSIDLKAIQTTDQEEVVKWDNLSSPEIGIKAQRYRRTSFEDDSLLGYGYTVIAYIDHSAAFSGFVSGEGPAIILTVSEEDLIAFAQRLVEEMRLLQG